MLKVSNYGFGIPVPSLEIKDGNPDVPECKLRPLVFQK